MTGRGRGTTDDRRRTSTRASSTGAKGRAGSSARSGGGRGTTRRASGSAVPKPRRTQAAGSTSRAGTSTTRKASTAQGRSAATDRSGAPGRPAGAASRPRTRKQARPQAARSRRTPKKRRPATVRLASGPLRIRFVLVMVAVVVSLFAGRLIQLQGLDASTYAAAARQIGVTTEELVAARGDIVDRNGQPLAATSEAYNLWVDHKSVENPAAYALQLSEVLDGDLATLQRTVTGEKRFQYVAKGISGQQWRQIQSLKLPGLGADPVPRRTYPVGSVGGNIVGFIGSDGEGLAGLEQSQDSILTGVDGSATYQRGPGGQRLPSGAANAVQDPQEGTGLALTLDRDLQWYTEEALDAAVEHAGADSGVAVVMDTETFEIMAMAGTPRLDPARPADVDAADRGNKAVEYAYEPGSVFKPLTMAAVVDAGVAGPASVYSVPGSIERSGETINDHYSHGVDQMTLAGILAKSSNVGTLMAAEGLGKDVFSDYLSSFGIGRPLDLGLPAATRGSLATDMSDLTRDNISFGQGVAVNVVQMAAAYATIANGGIRLDPTLIAAELDADGEPRYPEQGDGTRVISQDTADAVTAMMETVMGPDGTGSPAAVDGYRVAGKTGTAQRIDPECGCYRGYNSSFMGFAPADDPKYAVAVSLFNARNGNSGGQLAGPAFADIMGFALERAGVAPSGTEPQSLPVFGE